MTNRFTQLLLYTLYFLAACVFFLYVLFPAESVKNALQRQVQALNPAWKLTIGRLQPALPWRLSLTDIGLYLHGRQLFTAQQGMLSPRLLSLLGAEKRFDFKTSTTGGHIRVRVDHPPPKLAAEIHLERIKLQQIPALQKFSGRSIAGVFSGTFHYRQAAADSTVDGTFKLSNVTIALTSPFLGLKNAVFRVLAGKFTLRQNKLQISDCTFTGRQTDGRLAGSVSLKNPLTDSRLSLKTVIRPHAELLAVLKHNPSAKWLISNAKANSGFALKLGGTIAKPSIGLQ